MIKTHFAAILVLVALLLLPAVSPAAVQHTVAKGDTLSSLSKKYKITIKELKAANQLKNEKLKVGAKLNLPAKAQSVAPVKSVKSLSAQKDKPGKNNSSATPTVQFTQTSAYSVKKGDTLLAIAGKTGISVKELKKLNELKSNRLKIGQELKVPATEPETETVAENERQGPQTASRSNALSDEQPTTLEGVKDEALVSNEEAPEEGEELRPSDPAQEDILLKIASRYLGVPYRFGGSTQNGIDCSAFVQKVFGFLSVDLPRTAREQFRTGQKVAKRDLKEGDLVFFKTYARYASHVGIYIGDNKFIHASSRDKKVSISNLDTPYYTKRFIGAKRMEVEKKL